MNNAALETRPGSGHTRTMPEKSQNADLVLIKRYLSLDDLADMVLNGQRFIVRESETNRDITRNILNRLH